MLQSNWGHQAPLAVQERSRSGDNNDEGLCSWGPSLCSFVIDFRIGKSCCGSSDRSWLRTGIEQRVEEELISHFRLRAVLRPETKENDSSLAYRFFCDDRCPFEKLPSKNPSTQKRFVGIEERDRMCVAVDLKGRAVLVEDGDSWSRSERDGIGRVHSYLQDRSGDALRSIPSRAFSILPLSLPT